MGEWVAGLLYKLKIRRTQLSTKLKLKLKLSLAIVKSIDGRVENKHGKNPLWGGAEIVVFPLKKNICQNTALETDKNYLNFSGGEGGILSLDYNHVMDLNSFSILISESSPFLIHPKL